MSRDFTERTKGRVHDIKTGTALEVGWLEEMSEYWVCQDLVNIEGYDVAGSEAENLRIIRKGDQCALFNKESIHLICVNFVG